MKKILLTFIMVACATSVVFAQRSSISEENREKWLSEMRNLKHEYLARELSLSKEQQDAFFPIYDAMDDELTQVASEMRDMEAQVINNTEATEGEMLEVARAMFEQKAKEGAIEVSYYDKFKETITPQQLIRLKNAERKFTQQLVKRHGRAKADLQRRSK